MSTDENRISEILSNTNLTKREAISALVQAGLTVSDAYERLGDHITDSSQSVPQVTDELIAQYSEELQSLASHPSVLADLREIEAEDEDETKVFRAQEFVEKWKQTENLNEIGFSNDEFRLALRVFEKPSYENLGQTRTLATTEPMESIFESSAVDVAPRATVCGSIGFIVCGSIGGELK